MSRVRANLAANLAGQGWTVFLALVCTPFYLRLLGVEAYGLIAFYLVVQSIVQLLDLGLAATVNREVARWSALRDSASIAPFIVTLERWYWALGALLGVALFFALPAVADWWLRPQDLAADELLWSGRAFACLALLQWPGVFYQNAMAGLQRQVAMNAIQMPFAALSSIGGVIFIWLGPRSVAWLVCWQAAVLALQLLVLRGYFWRHVGFKRSGGASFGMVGKHWRFSLGMSGITIAGLVATHLDKVILSRILPLQEFGYYSLAVTVARSLYVLITPVFNTYFPRLSGLVASGDPESLRMSYRTATQAMAVLIVPPAALFALFPAEIIGLWLQDPALAAATAPIAALLVVGTCLNGLMNVPYALQLATGRTGIGLAISLGLVVILVPAIIYAASHYGATGGAAMWAVTNGIYLLVGMPITHHYLMRGASTDWLLKGVVPAFLAAIAVVGATRWLVSALAPMPVWVQSVLIALAGVFATLAAAALSSQIRGSLLQAWARRAR